MNLVNSITAVGAALSLGAGSITLCYAMKFRHSPVKAVLSQAGRDQAVVRMLQGAQKSIYLRTEALTMVPAGNELAQAFQRHASVTVELPLDGGFNVEQSRLPRILMELGAVVTFKSDAAANYRGTLLLVDDSEFLYSASPLTLSAPGAKVSYVIGPVER